MVTRLDFYSRYVLLGPMTRGDILPLPHRLCPTEADRYAVADHVVAQLKERGDPWQLAEEAERKDGMPTTR
jgi:hypothetical protein